MATLAAGVGCGSARFARFRNVLDLVAEVGERVEALRAAGRIFHFLSPDHAFCVRDVKLANVMLGVNATTDSYRFNESRAGAEHWVGGSKGFAHPALSKAHTRTRGVTGQFQSKVFS